MIKIICCVTIINDHSEFTNVKRKRLFLPFVRSVTTASESWSSDVGCVLFTAGTEGPITSAVSEDTRDPLTSYGVPYSRGIVFIGTTKHRINTCVDVHRRHYRLGKTLKSAIAEHSLSNKRPYNHVWRDSGPVLDLTVLFLVSEEASCNIEARRPQHKIRKSITAEDMRVEDDL